MDIPDATHRRGNGPRFPGDNAALPDESRDRPGGTHTTDIPARPGNRPGRPRERPGSNHNPGVPDATGDEPG
ncbi:hypothetical protein JCM33774_52260 [Actinophytocola sp. KF-1]